MCAHVWLAGSWTVIVTGRVIMEEVYCTVFLTAAHPAWQMSEHIRFTTTGISGEEENHISEIRSHLERE